VPTLPISVPKVIQGLAFHATIGGRVRFRPNPHALIYRRHREPKSAGCQFVRGRATITEDSRSLRATPTHGYRGRSLGPPFSLCGGQTGVPTILYLGIQGATHDFIPTPPSSLSAQPPRPSFTIAIVPAKGGVSSADSLSLDTHGRRADHIATLQTNSKPLRGRLMPCPFLYGRHRSES
jgi:hypothetical protein